MTYSARTRINDDSEQMETCSYPSYLNLFSTGELHERVQELWRVLEDCRLCPRACRKNRLAGKIGVCRMGKEVWVSSYAPHFGEEAPLVGHHGSGTIFFSNCNLWCLYCQNYEISHLKGGTVCSHGELARMMLSLQAMGCHNINLVTPTHVVPHIVAALAIAVQEGLRLPIVYNSSGYESVEILRLLGSIVDIYMPDIKYSDNECAQRYSGLKDYWDVVRPAIREMHRQAGDLFIDGDGIARKGLLIRHLVLPNDVAGSQGVLEFIAREVSKNSYVNIMDQYRPAFKANMIPQLSRRVTTKEYSAAVFYAQRLGLRRGL